MFETGESQCDASTVKKPFHIINLEIFFGNCRYGLIDASDSDEEAMTSEQAIQHANLQSPDDDMQEGKAPS